MDQKWGRKMQALCCGAVLTMMSTWTMASFATQNTAVSHNIARGLPPELPEQSIQVLQDFQGDFRILSTKRYVDDEQAKFSPIDYAVSWGLFAEPQVANHIRVKQFDRYLQWSIPVLPIPAEQAIQMVSNMHIIPANPKMAREIERVSKGDLVRMRGELVEVKSKDLVWRSSLTPTDTGDGACEVFRVHAIEWLERS